MKDLSVRMKILGILESDLDEKFVRSGGHGGQNVNKVSSCVILTHRPSGISIRAEEARSQAKNRILARERLVERLVDIEKRKKILARAAQEKRHRQNRKPNRAAKEKVLKSKHYRSEIKKNRKRVYREDH